MAKALSKLVGIDQFGNSAKPQRVKWLEKALAEIPAGHRMLDAGAGELQFKKFCSHLDYVSQDFGQYDGTGDGAGLQTGIRDNSKLDIVSDITSIPVEDSSFDAVMCIEVLEHVPSPEKALAELTRVLKPGGVLIVTSPFNSLTHYAPYHFATGFNSYFYRHHLDLLGFDILEVTPNGNYFEYVAGEIKRLGDMSRRYSRRRLSVVGLVASVLLLWDLVRINRKSKGSEELGCFGYLVKARKR
jgi:SAM-dependent methyltransferase